MDEFRKELRESREKPGAIRAPTVAEVEEKHGINEFEPTIRHAKV